MRKEKSKLLEFLSPSVRVLKLDSKSHWKDTLQQSITSTINKFLTQFQNSHIR